MLLEREPTARVFALDTHVLFPETYAVWREVERRYGISIQVYEGPSLGRQGRSTARSCGSKPRSCCSIRKIGPLGAALSGLDGWITGVRRDQSPTRSGTPKLGWTRHEIWKASRLADWTDDDVCHPRARPPRQPAPRARLRFDRLHALHGTWHRPPGSLGRWRHTECGLHA